jgi:hypothetical protein
MATLSSIITPTNITTASNTQTLTNKTITGGILNGTLGATTPSTVAATTISASALTTIASSAFVTNRSIPASGAGLEIYYQTNASGLLSYDRTSSAYKAMNIGATTVSIDSSGSGVGVFSSTGLAVTGALSCTSTLSTTNEIWAVSPTGTGSAAIRTAFTNCGLDMSNSNDTSGVGFINFRKADSTQIGGIARVGTTNAVVYNTTSDARLKENLRDFKDSGRLIDALKPRVFDWKGDTNGDGKNVIGFVAQEEHAADPIFAHIGAVSVGDDDPTTITKQWQRSDAALIPILVAELQSLRKRLAALESK